MPAAPGTLRTSPANVVRALDATLRRRGVSQLYSAACDVFGVVSIETGLTVWTNGRVLLWRYNGVSDAYPAADIEAVADRLAALIGHMGDS